MSNDGIDGKGFNEDEILEVLGGGNVPVDNRPLCPYGVNRGRCNDKVDGNECEGKPHDCQYYEDIVK